MFWLLQNNWVIGPLFTAFAYLFFTGVITYAAYARGRAWFTWLLFALFLTPLSAGLCLALFPIDQRALDQREDERIKRTRAQAEKWRQLRARATQ